MNPFRFEDFCCDESRCLSKVMEDVGVSQTMVETRRQAGLIMENMETVREQVCYHDQTCYYFGSQTEGTTTVGLGSDRDKLFTFNKLCVVKHESDAIGNDLCYLQMIQDQDTPPGYCKLKRISGDLPFVNAKEIDRYSYYDKHGNKLLKNIILNDDETRRKDLVRHGPASTNERFNQDFVNAFPIKMVPDEARLDQKDLIEVTGFVVPVGHTESENERLEFRISTSLSERKFMFGLNITQIRCYILLKLIKKTFVEPVIGEVISSFMCKTVLMHIVAETKRKHWSEENLMSWTFVCLKKLRYCVAMKKCPHFFVPENNLMYGRIDPYCQKRLFDIIDRVTNDLWRSLQNIHIDGIGSRLCGKVNLLDDILMKRVQYEIEARKYALQHLCATFITKNCMENEDVYSNMKDRLMHVMQIEQGQREQIVKEAAKLIYPIICAYLGSMVASSCLWQGAPPSGESLALLSKSIEDGNDRVYGKLKLASVVYVFGVLYDEAETLLGEVEKDLKKHNVQMVCNCRNTEPWVPEWQFPDEAVTRTPHPEKSSFACGIAFTRWENYCIPREMLYEMYRCTKNELKKRDNLFFYWSDWAVVDTLPYLYFLQFKTYGKLGNTTKQEEALRSLSKVIQKEPRLFHRDTALNLLGQCCEEKELYFDAFVCYYESLGQMPTHNAARWLAALLLWKIYKINRDVNEY